MGQERFPVDAKQTFAGEVANDVKFGGLEKCAPLRKICHLVPRCLRSQDEEYTLTAWALNFASSSVETRSGVALNPAFTR